VHRGVFAVGHPELSAEGRWLAAALACGPSSLISHTTAGQLWGVLERDARSPIHVTILGRSGRATPGFRVHRPRELPAADRSIRAGIPVTSPTRSIWDLATLVSPARTSRALDEGARLGVLDRTRLGELTEARPRHRGSAEIRRWLAAAHAPLSETRSRLEAVFLRLCRKHSLPMPATNVPVLGYEVDFLWRAARLVVEVDGGWHRGGRRDRDNERDVALSRRGYLVRRYSWTAVTDASKVAAEIGSILRERR
jgi:very-short-patch-repair endonuclease